MIIDVLFFLFRFLSFLPLTILLLAQINNFLERKHDELASARVNFFLLTFVLWFDLVLYLSGYFNQFFTGTNIQEYITILRGVFLLSKMIAAGVVWNLYKTVFSKK